jgi:hypothetical protein
MFINDKIMSLVETHPRTLSELVSLTGQPEATLIAALKQLGQDDLVWRDPETMLWCLEGVEPPAPTMSAPVVDAAQAAAITLGWARRAVVEAGPGTGKTYTACARVAHLLEQEGLEPHELLIISFTRIALHELRQRLRAQRDVGGLQLRTIDQLAYGLNNAELAGSYEASIQRALGHLQQLEEPLPLSFRHIIVDEAQDIVGARAELITGLIAHLCANNEVGVTVFHDPAQAIYDWSAQSLQGEDKRYEAQRLVVRLVHALRREGLIEQTIELHKIYRTADESLASMMRSGRHTLLNRRGWDALERIHTGLQGVRTPLVDDALVAVISASAVEQPTMLLLRGRLGVARWSVTLADAGVSHIARFGGKPQEVPPWIALVLNAIPQPIAKIIAKAQFDRAWDAVVSSPLLASLERDACWELLLEQAFERGERLDVGRLADLIARIAPPAALTEAHAGLRLTLSTIHGSKGREAERVFMAARKRLPKTDSEEAAAEEARVLFVGLSRAKRELTTISLTRGISYRGEVHGRPWGSCRSSKGEVVCCLVGMTEDVSLLRGLGVTFEDEGSAAQALLAGFDGAPRRITARRDEDGAHRLLCEAEEIGALSSRLLADLRTIHTAHGRGGYLFNELKELSWLGVRTVALSAQDPRASSLRGPWRNTRLWLAPVILGAPMVTMIKRRGAT